MNLANKKPRPGSRGKYKNLYSKNIIKPSPIEINAVLPRDVVAEDNLLSHCLSNGDATDCAMKICYPEDFSRKGAEAVFERIVHFRKQGRSYSPELIDRSFDNREDSQFFSDFIWSLPEFWHLSDMGPIRHYARIVQEFGLRRRLLLGCVTVASELFDVSTNVNELADRTKKLGAVSSFRSKKNEVTNAT
jgi:replicative DNA helicase